MQYITSLLPMILFLIGGYIISLATPPAFDVAWGAVCSVWGVGLLISAVQFFHWWEARLPSSSSIGDVPAPRLRSKTDQELDAWGVEDQYRGWSTWTSWNDPDGTFHSGVQYISPYGLVDFEFDKDGELCNGRLVS